MKRPSFRPCGLRGFALAILVLFTASRQSQTAPPDWWQRFEAVDLSAPQNDYAAINQGQLKSLAYAAMLAMDEVVPHGGAGPEIHAMVAGWLAASAAGQGNDYAAVNVGQLKTVVRYFYTRLASVNFHLPLPWTPATTDDSDYALATVGQAKTVFAFDLDRDSDLDGISDFEEGIAGEQPGGDPIDSDGDGTPDSEDTDSDDDGTSDEQEAEDGTNSRSDDTDSDGIKDKNDAFPNDPNSFLPIRRYAAVDMGAALRPDATWQAHSIGITNENDIAVSYYVGSEHLGVARLLHGQSSILRNTAPRTRPTVVSNASRTIEYTPDYVTGLGSVAAHGKLNEIPGENADPWGYLQFSATSAANFNDERQLGGQTDLGTLFGSHSESVVRELSFVGTWTDQIEVDDPPEKLHFDCAPLDPFSTPQSAGGGLVAGTKWNSSDSNPVYDIAVRGGSGGVHSLFPVGNGLVHAANGGTAVGIHVAATHPKDPTPRDNFSPPPFHWENGILRNFHALIPDVYQEFVRIPTSWQHEFAGAVNQNGDVLFSGQLKDPSNQFPQGWRPAILLLLRGTTVNELVEVVGAPGGAAPFGAGFNNNRWICGGGLLYLPVEVMTPKNGSITESYSDDLIPARGLRIGKMERSLDQSHALHIAKDADRFYFRVQGLTQSAGGMAVKARVSTVDNPEPGYNDDPTWVDMIVQSGEFTSRSLLLVADTKDDEYYASGAVDIGADNTSGGNDRTHKVQLGGKFMVDAIEMQGLQLPTQFTLPVPARRRLTSNFLYLGAASANRPLLQRHLQIVKERYAQLGVDIVLNEHDLPVPAGVDQENVGEQSGDVMQSVHPDVKKIVDAATMASLRSQVLLIAVPNLRAPGVAGHAYPPRGGGSAGIDMQYRDVALISVQDVLTENKLYTVAHELGHLLTNAGHYGEEFGYGKDNTGPVPQHLIDHNLMKSQTSTDEEIGASKRLYQHQAKRLREALLQKLD